MEQDDGDNWLIDDVDLTSLPTCDAPSALTLSNLTQTSALVSWTAPGAQTGYNLRLYEGTDATTTPIIEQLGLSGSAVNSASYLSGLIAETQYYFTIESVCGSDLSAEEGLGFTTSAAPITPDYIEEFNVFPGDKWFEASGTFADGPTGTTSDWQSDLFINQGTNTSAKVNIYFSNQNHWLISPDFDLSGGSYELTMDVAVTEWNLTTSSNMGSDDNVKLLVSENSGITWAVLYTWDASNTPSNTGTALSPIDLTTYTGTVRFALLASDGTTNDVEDYDFFMDNFSIAAIADPCTSAGIDVITACDSYTWIDGVTYTVANKSATHMLTNAAGCDSTVTLDLTINNSNTGVDVITACDSYTWIDGVTYTVANNSATHVLTNAAGCDSTVTLDLTINNSNTATDVITACDSYTWIDGVTYTVANNSATHVLTNAAGCDSTVTLDLTINNSNTGVDVITACDNYTWIDGVNYNTSNNSGTHVLTNAAGCDSTVTLNLTINNANNSVDVITAINDYTWIDGVNYNASNNSATHVLTNAAGCDSTVTLNLTIIIIDVSVTQSGALLNAVMTGATYQWLNCPAMTAIPGATNQSYTATTNGDYAVEITKNGYSDTSICYTVLGVGFIENSFNDEILLYPNPTNGNFSIDLRESYNTVNITITDMRGNLIESKIYNKRKLISLELEFPAGIYFLKIESKDKKAVIRLVKK